MKVLKDNYNEERVEEITIEPYPRELECEKCGSKLEYEKEDMEVGVLGCMHVRCPLCGYNNMLDGNECDITLTKDNVEFPLHFFHTSKEDGAVESCNNNNIKREINRAIEYFRKNKDGYHWFTNYGNLYISVRRYEGDEDYDVVVTNNFYNTLIPFEPEDY